MHQAITWAADISTLLQDVAFGAFTMQRVVQRRISTGLLSLMPPATHSTSCGTRLLHSTKSERIGIARK
jgi:hypothetical protein